MGKGRVLRCSLRMDGWLVLVRNPVILGNLYSMIRQ